MKESFQAIRGMNDITPPDSFRWARLERELRDWLDAYGYHEVRFPIVESTALFVRSIGTATDIVEKEMYSFVDGLNGEALTLRPEGTASCVRLALQQRLLYEGPRRLWYQGPMFRHERPQKGRYRQFHQCGIEALGFSGPDIDAELILMTARLWQRLGLSEVALQLNSIGSSAARARYRERLKSYFQRYFHDLDEDSQRRVSTNPLRILDSKNPGMAALIASAPQLAEDLDEDSRRHFDGLQDFLSAAGVRYTLNPRLVRGLDYYNATVFEWVTTRLGAQGTVCGGGRYDGLVEQLGGKPTPACGFAMGMERLLALLELVDGWNAEYPVLHAYVMNQNQVAWAVKVAEELRAAGLRTILHAGGGSFKSQFRRADASGARYAIILGDAEWEQQRIALKPLRGQGEQQSLLLEEVVTRIRMDE
ncbi:MAG: histidine--tRNA ligase [Betaproteobacteria bacterium]|jgi:histidyl-tRNA synthetase (EC 6.1.1.21)|nr:histidine--tRNA ligase [Betaproteobacteria bacterium]